METNAKFVMVALVLAVAIASCPAAAGGGGRAICNMSQEGFDACKPSVSSPNPLPPSLVCCTALANADLQCLCLFKNARMLLQAYGVDPTLALELPAKCNLAPNFHC